MHWILRRLFLNFEVSNKHWALCFQKCQNLMKCEKSNNQLKEQQIRELERPTTGIILLATTTFLKRDNMTALRPGQRPSPSENNTSLSCSQKAYTLFFFTKQNPKNRCPFIITGPCPESLSTKVFLTHMNMTWDRKLSVKLNEIEFIRIRTHKDTPEEGHINIMKCKSKEKKQLAKLIKERCNTCAEFEPFRSVKKRYRSHTSIQNKH